MSQDFRHRTDRHSRPAYPRYPRKFPLDSHRLDRRSVSVVCHPVRERDPAVAVVDAVFDHEIPAVPSLAAHKIFRKLFKFHPGIRMDKTVFDKGFRKTLHNCLRTAALFVHIKCIVGFLLYIHFPHKMGSLSKSNPQSLVAFLQLALCPDQIRHVCGELQYHRIFASGIGDPGHSGLSPDPVPPVSGDPVDMFRRLFVLGSIPYRLHVLGYMIRMDPDILKAAGKDKPIRRNPQHTEKTAACIDHPDLRPRFQKGDASVQITDQRVHGNSVQFPQSASVFPFPHFCLVRKQAAAPPAVFLCLKKRCGSLSEQNIKRKFFSCGDICSYADRYL